MSKPLLHTSPVARAAQALWHLPRRLLIGVIRLYQHALSPMLPNACRFAPSCSSYAIEALRRYGFARGLILASWRVLRCNPWGGHGYDPPRWFGEDPDAAIKP